MWEVLIEAQRGRSGEVLASQRADERRSRLQSAILKLDRRRRAGEDAMASVREGGSGDLCLWEEKSTRFVDVDELQRRGVVRRRSQRVKTVLDGTDLQDLIMKVTT